MIFVISIPSVTDGGFEGNHGWTILNTSNVNKWIVGEGEKTAGVKGAYVSNNNSINSITNPQSSNSKIYIYKDVIVPSNAYSISLSFKYKNAGNNDPKPRCLFALASAFPPLPTGGNQMIVGAEFATFLNNATNWTTYTNDTPLSTDRLVTYTSQQLIPGETYRVVFEWSATNQTSFTQTSPITKYPTGGSIQTTASGYTPGGYMDYTFTSNNDGNNFGLEWSVDNGAQIVSGQGTPNLRFFVPLGTTGTIYTSLRYTYPTPTYASNGTNSGPLAIDEVAMTFSAIPKITSIAPLSGPVGSSVTLTGEFFGATDANNVVYLGGVKCPITAATANSITVTVPANATLNNFSVLNTTTNLICYSSSKFVPTNSALSGLSYNSNTLTSFEAPVTFTTGTFASSFDQKFVLADVNQDGASGDLNGDGKTDVVLSGTGRVSVLKNTTNQGNPEVKTFSFIESTTKAINAGIGYAVKLADLDLDGKLDVISTNSTSGFVSVFRNDSDNLNLSIMDAQHVALTGLTATYGAISFATSVTLYSATGIAYPQLELADIDGDNKPDIIAANGTNGIVLFRNRVAEAGKLGTDQTICYNTTPAALTSVSPATFSSAGTITYKWQKSTSPTGAWTDIASTNTLAYTIPSALTTTTYYRRAAALSTAPTVFYFTNPITITVIPNPTITATVPATACGSTTVVLGATSSGGVVKATGATFTTPTIATSTTYYAQAETASGCISTAARTPVVATIITVVPVINTPGNNARCDAGSLTITPILSAATAIGATINWYANPTGGSPIGSGPSFTTPEITSTTTFYADATNCNGTSARTAFVATVLATPSVLSTTSNIGCKGTNVVLSATSSAGSVLNWYTAETGGTPSVSNATVSNIQANTTRYVSAAFTSNGVTCESPRTAVTAVMFAVPVAPTAIHTTLCGIGNTATVSVTPPANTVVNWFSSPSGGVSLGTGNSYTTEVLNSASSRSYYASVTDVNGCISSPRTKVDIVYNGPTVSSIASVNAVTNSAVTFSATIANQTTFNWQRSTDNGLNWADITANIDPNVTYSGFSGTTGTTTTLTINSAVSFIHKYQYRLKLAQSASCINYSNTAILNVADVFGSCSSSVAAIPTAFGVNTSVISSWKNYKQTTYYYPYTDYDTGQQWAISYLGYNSYYREIPSLSDRSQYDNGSTTGLIVNNSAAGQAYITLDLGGSKLIDRVDLAGLSTFNPYAGNDTDENLATPILDNDANDFFLVAKLGHMKTVTMQKEDPFKLAPTGLHGLLWFLTSVGRVGLKHIIMRVMAHLILQLLMLVMLGLTASDCNNECSLSVTIELKEAVSYYTSAAGSNAMQTLSSWKTGTDGTTASNVFVLANSASTYSSGASYSNSGSLRLNGNIATLGNYNATWGAVLESSISSSPQSYVKTNGTGVLTISTSTVPVLFPVGNSTYNAVTLTNNTGTTDTYSMVF
ncbi:hypothetical protein GHT06_004499 [Daphnia sinensis]|uniref:Uncharacterized protein n=1 Tax=Daphnia sinensis TaxID=1820382 RepID=A0AAD5PMC1_9CRUS|nr:hypothetical protein GHT06_004499 [Daphnia sinensis]